MWSTNAKIILETRRNSHFNTKTAGNGFEFFYLSKGYALEKFVAPCKDGHIGGLPLTIRPVLPYIDHESTWKPNLGIYIRKVGCKYPQLY